MLKPNVFSLLPRTSCALRFAWQGLITARQRALLALLGIMIGVGAVVALISIGKSVERKALSEFEKMGTQVMNISMTSGEFGLVKKHGPTSLKNIRPEQIIAAIKALPEVELVSELLSIACQANESNRQQTQQQLNAVAPEFAQIAALKMSTGRFLHPLDREQLWVVLGAQVASQLQQGGSRLQPGSDLSLCGTRMRLAGIVKSQPASETISIDIDHSALISVAAGRRIDAFSPTETLIIRVHQEVSPLEFAPRLSTLLSELTGKEINITTAQKVIELRQQQAATYTRFLTALSSISLLVGSLGILNIMLIAVVERRREIGLRLAIGADDIDITLQFLFESMLLALAGGIAGILVGLIAAATVSHINNLPFVLPVFGIPLAIAVSLIVGVAAGLYPAMQAAKLNPVETLQSA